MAAPEGATVPDLPFPIFQISPKVTRYLLYDIKTVTWLRRTHKILGVFIGSLPQSPQQNVFLGLPLELQPEEVRWLVEKNTAFIVDDLESHKRTLQSPPAQLEVYKISVRKEGLATARAVGKQKQQRTQEALQRLNVRQSPRNQDTGFGDAKAGDTDNQDESLFDAPLTFSSTRKSIDLIPFSSTPTTSYPPLPPPPQHPSPPIPEVDSSSYALFKHLHSKGYFLSPGLRFGCQFSVYPGDPLRFHSHFLATSAGWDEEIDLLDIVGGGRLGTGVKKGWLIGGVQTMKESRDEADDSASQPTGRGDDTTQLGSVRTFCIEWGGM
ncbi:MAG: hypothetical protein L6R39_005519 [Caloplaca ligustica]|nr:MAG: hypothetical protein L6R39_005519 [Caloplaca ligustica]